MIRTAVLAVLTLGALAAPALAFEVKQAPAPRAGGSAFGDTRGIARMMPAATSEAFRFGPADQAAASKGPKVIYLLPAGKPSDQVDVTNPRDNPFMPQPERSDRSAH
ncbi:MAG: hypothetical protein ACXU82_09965 [Caulobacteraceae bacterium]